MSPYKSYNYHIFSRLIRINDTSKISFSSVAQADSVVVDSLLIVAPIVGFCVCSIFCCALFCLISCFAIIMMGKIVLVALSSWWLVIVIVLWLFLTVPWIGLQCVIVVFYDHTLLLF